MNIRNTADEYGLIAKLLHWVMAIMVIVQIPIGWYTSGLSDETALYWRMLDLHVALGLCVFMFFLVRAGWMVMSPPPRLDPALAPWERRLARFVHIYFIVALAFLPITGFIYITSNGEPFDLYHVIEFPALASLSKGVRHTLADAHMYVAYGCAVLIVLHVAGALKHHFFDAKSSLRRMAF